MMRFISSLALIALSLNATGAFAHETEQKLSADVRDEKNFGVGVLTGVGATGLEGFIQIDRQFSIGLAAETMEAKVESDWSWGYSTAKAKADTMFVQARWFLGNSFYLKAALGYREMDIDIEMVDISDSRSADVSMKYQTFLGGAGLGNMWTFDSGFYLGAEWFGVYAPLASTHHTSSDIRGFSAEGRKRLDRSIKSAEDCLAEISTVHAAILTMGMMF